MLFGNPFYMISYDFIICDNIANMACLMSRLLMHAGAQSDSEVAETAAMADGHSDRGYTSDSELYDAPKRDSALSSSDTKLKPSSGSWLMVIFIAVDIGWSRCDSLIIYQYYYYINLI